MFSPYIEPGEISNLPAYNYYARLAAVNAQEPLSGETLLLEDQGNKTVRDAVITHSRKCYARKQENTNSSGQRTTKKNRRQKIRMRRKNQYHDR